MSKTMTMYECACRDRALYQEALEAILSRAASRAGDSHAERKLSLRFIEGRARKALTVTGMLSTIEPDSAAKPGEMAG